MLDIKVKISSEDTEKIEILKAAGFAVLPSSRMRRRLVSRVS